VAEIVFVNSIIREAEEEANLREDALESIKKAKEEFEKMLPTLRAAESVQERENLTTNINVLITSAVTSYLIPRYKSQDEFKERAEKKYHLVQRWLLTFQLLGPYVWD
jgi:muramoyltetrapeptide carboxypeptidase LdcA involved in peptidoglycan recycling